MLRNTISLLKRKCNMEVLEFKLRGETAFFKIPEVNTYRYLTYSSIHKVAILGLLGSIVGLKGYRLDQEGEYPEFYERLHGLKCSVEIINPMDIKKKYQQFNNSVGYASKEKGNNLIITEQWLEKPCWIIRILVDSIPDEIPLVEYLLNKRTVYMPYLGKNDHFATIEDVNIVVMEPVEELKDKIIIKGIFEESMFSIKLEGRIRKFYKYTEYLPVGLDPILNQYITKPLTQTDGKLEWGSRTDLLEINLYKTEDDYYYFM
ncbi:type I-B CRISPR-associated protein Cas5 [Tissierella creatinini]|nr:type I-B CRISPR-associated protein Cas5 [Tissierella creatinini]TJX64599.1 type I-B CRISPR-associated protein Cas5 [Soehngenia saccharolytica]